MLDEMKINYEQILPDLDSVEKTINSKDYKMLGDAEVIKIQKFFIKKLAAKLPSKWSKFILIYKKYANH